MHGDIQRLYDIIAVLVGKLGGEATITAQELENPPKGTASTMPDGTFTIKTE